jgi:peptidyl-tRNA hydrolase, PTH1 family
MSQVVVGLGNPGPEYQDTRHNIGQQVLDVLAERLHRAWRRESNCLIARAQWRGEPLALVKPQTFMNVTGPTVAAALRKLDAVPSELVLVFDDIDMELGKVRMRMKGSAGGHNGVRSVIAALGTDEIRRVKVGIGRPEHKHDVPDHVLTTFEADERLVVDQAVQTAADRVLELLARAR